jgi:hypothetical protein
MLEHKIIVMLQAQRHCMASNSLLHAVQLQGKSSVSSSSNLSKWTAPGENEALTAEQLQHCWRCCWLHDWTG